MAHRKGEEGNKGGPLSLSFWASICSAYLHTHTYFLLHAHAYAYAKEREREEGGNNASFVCVWVLEGKKKKGEGNNQGAIRKIFASRYCAREEREGEKREKKNRLPFSP